VDWEYLFAHGLAVSYWRRDNFDVRESLTPPHRIRARLHNTTHMYPGNQSTSQSNNSSDSSLSSRSSLNSPHLL
jgi:hypothetical protein